MACRCQHRDAAQTADAGRPRTEGSRSSQSGLLILPATGSCASTEARLLQTVSLRRAALEGDTAHPRKPNVSLKAHDEQRLCRFAPALYGSPSKCADCAPEVTPTGFLTDLALRDLRITLCFYLVSPAGIEPATY